MASQNAIRLALETWILGVGSGTVWLEYLSIPRGHAMIRRILLTLAVIVGFSFAVYFLKNLIVLVILGFCTGVTLDKIWSRHDS